MVWPPPFGCLEGTSWPGGDQEGAGIAGAITLQRAQEVQEVLLLRLAKVLVPIDDPVGLGGLNRALAGLWWARIAWMRSASAAVEQEEIQWAIFWSPIS